MATNVTEELSKLKKADLVERLSKRLAKLSKEQLVTLSEKVEEGAIDLVELATPVAPDAGGFGFQQQVKSELAGKGGGGKTDA